MRILIVEDEALVALDMREMLLSIGHDVVGIARDVGEALSLAKADPRELALVDYALTHGDNGSLITRMLRSLFKTPSLFVSANPNDCNDTAGTDRVLSCLSKPFTELGSAHGAGHRRSDHTRSEADITPTAQSPDVFLRVLNLRSAPKSRVTLSSRLIEGTPSASVGYLTGGAHGRCISHKPGSTAMNPATGGPSLKSGGWVLLAYPHS